MIVKMRFLFFKIGTVLFSLASLTSAAQTKQELLLPGLQAPVEVLRDKWGINHIYAGNQHDLFFVQGYCAAKDRLFQFEIWRRQATGTVAELLGLQELKRDIGARLFKFRGNMDKEFRHYHKDGILIIDAYTAGVNAYIDETLKNPDLLPAEFKILGIKPGKWTPEVVISRHQGLKGNVAEELEMGKAVSIAGADKVKEMMWFHPKDPDLRLDSSINLKMLSENILELYNRFQSPVSFTETNSFSSGIKRELLEPEMEGSNNWIISGQKTASGFPYLANDPHRAISLPSLRYMVHLVAPGWNVIGGGEPVIPGVSIGHNENGAWGLTIFKTDSEDLYVYDLNPENLSQYKYKGRWMTMQEIKESIPVKGKENEEITLKYTMHGPVTFIDSSRHKGYAVRSGWLEPGGAPYLASLRINQAKTWADFRKASTYSNLPGVNMMWADKTGDIGWQVVGIAPIRKNFSGMIPVPGDGRYEWAGYLNIKKRPSVLNPKNGFFATANQNVTPAEYRHWNTISYTWADPFRGDRIDEVLEQGQRITLEETAALQTDYLSIPARTLVPMLRNITLNSPFDENVKSRLTDWNFVLDKNSVPAGIYVMWERILIAEANSRFVPAELNGLVRVQLKKLMDWLQTPDAKFGIGGRDAFLAGTFEKAIKDLKLKLGNNIDDWTYGQDKYKHAALNHSLNGILLGNSKGKYNIGPLPRGGNNHTPNSTGGTDLQGSGASFRLITDLADWDKTLMINTPGQSADPGSRYYKNLFELWAKDQYFPSYFSKDKIEAATEERTILSPTLKDE